jgi:anoctamin-10
MHGVTTAPLSSTTTITPAERIRLVYEYLVSPSDQGGLSITPSVFPWNNVTAIFALHDKKVNDKWTHSWMSRNWKVGLQIEEHDMDLILNNVGLPLFSRKLPTEPRHILNESLNGV